MDRGESSEPLRTRSGTRFGTTASGATLLLPAWPNQPWWPLLVQLSDAMEIVQVARHDVIPAPGCHV